MIKPGRPFEDKMKSLPALLSLINFEVISFYLPAKEKAIAVAILDGRQGNGRAFFLSGFTSKLFISSFV